MATSDTSGPCHVCGTPQIARYERGDGVMVGTCCILVGIRVGERHEILRRLHDIGHNWSGPGCPVCLQERIERSVLWGDAP